MDKKEANWRNLMKRACIIFFMIITLVFAQVEQDEWLDPSSLKDKPIFTFKTMKASDSTILDYIQKDTSALNLEDSLTVRNGYRVQLISTQDLYQAETIAKRAEAFFNLPVYVVFESPYYKVRVGDFLSDLDALGVERKARQNGYPNAWIVPSEVYIPNPNRLYK